MLHPVDSKTDSSKLINPPFKDLSHYSVVLPCVEGKGHDLPYALIRVKPEGKTMNTEHGVHVALDARPDGLSEKNPPKPDSSSYHLSVKTDTLSNVISYKKKANVTSTVDA